MRDRIFSIKIILCFVVAGCVKLTRQMRMSNYFMLRDQAEEMSKYGESIEYVEEWEKHGSPMRSKEDRKWAGGV